MALAPQPADAGEPRAVRGMRVLLALGAALLLAYVVHALAGIGSNGIFSGWIASAVVLLAAVVCGWRALLGGADRAIWALVGLGIAIWTVGFAYYANVLVGSASVPIPSVSDGLLLFFYVPMYVAVALLARRYARHLGASLWLDGLIAAGAAAAVGAELALEPVLHATSGQSQLAALTILGYPVGDLLLLSMLIVPLAMLGRRAPRDVALLAAGMAVFAISDQFYVVEAANGTYAFGGILDAGWLLALLAMAFAATIPARTRPGTRLAARTPRHSAVAAVGGLVALLVITLQVLHDRNVVSLVAAVVTLLLVIARMLLSLRETGELLDARARDAVTDGLTGLPNRRALVTDLDAAVAAAAETHPTVLVLFDLDGFKAYNDTFGHPAGDALLTRIGGALRAAARDRARVYRMGGDEFCALVQALDGESPERIGAELAAAMGQHGEGFEVSASYGCAVAPLHGSEASALLRHADDEMYARKGTRRGGAERQVQDALLAALRERDPDLESHADGVAGLAAALGRRMHVGATELRTLVHAAALHDIGKIAIPDGILHKPAPLDTQEWVFVRSHTLIAQRIISAAPALGYAAQIVRSTQERWDGGGYPDGLREEEIPLAARVVALCSAYQAMTRERPYQRALTPEQAFEELHSCAGTQFDPQLIELLIDVVAHPERQRTREGTAQPDVSRNISWSA